MPLIELSPQAFEIAAQSLVAVECVSDGLHSGVARLPQTFMYWFHAYAGLLTACLPSVQYGVTVGKLGPQL